MVILDHCIDGYIGELGLLNPNDVETITVLKTLKQLLHTAASGVILITTKTGRKFQREIEFNTYTGFRESARFYQLDAFEYALLLNEDYANSGNQVPYANVSALGKGTGRSK
jgi:hypothetical protein